MWLVDSTLGVALPPRVRRLLVDALLAEPDESWCAVASLARNVASRLNPTITSGEADSQPAGGSSRDRSLGREHVDQAIGTLAWLGVVDVAIDDATRPFAARLTAIGRAALS
jgi:hypothetical protein